MMMMMMKHYHIENMYRYLTDIMSSVFVTVLLRNDENHLFRIRIPSGLGWKRICISIQ